jgi:transposase
LFTQADLGKVVAAKSLLTLEAWMNVHKNARLTLRRRQELVTRLEAGEPLKRLARMFAVSAHTARKWRARYQADGRAGLADRSSRPHTSPRLAAARLQLAAKVLRRQQWTCGQIAAALELSATTVARVLRRSGLSRRGRLTAPLVAQRYEHAAVGDLLHLDSKKLGRIRGLGQGSAFTSSAAPAGSTCTSPSMITRGWHTWSCSPTKGRPAPAAFCAARCAGFAPTAFACAGS